MSLDAKSLRETLETIERKGMTSADGKDSIENYEKTKCSGNFRKIESACEVPFKENQEKIACSESNKEALEHDQMPEPDNLRPICHGVADLSDWVSSSDGSVTGTIIGGFSDFKNTLKATASKARGMVVPGAAATTN